MLNSGERHQGRRPPVLRRCGPHPPSTLPARKSLEEFAFDHAAASDATPSLTLAPWTSSPPATTSCSWAHPAPARPSRAGHPRRPSRPPGRLRHRRPLGRPPGRRAQTTASRTGRPGRYPLQAPLGRLQAAVLDGPSAMVGTAGPNQPGPWSDQEPAVVSKKNRTVLTGWRRARQPPVDRQHDHVGGA
jgi:hypothetical protein